jgi:glutaredoxin-like YruB-family protein
MTPQVTIYTTDTCGYCKLAKQFMTEKNVAFQEVNVGRDREQARFMIEKSGQMGVPVIIVNNDGREDVIIGFDQNHLARSLGINA